MIKELTELSEVEQMRKEKRAARKKRQRRTLKRHCCEMCGQPKHYICLEHNQNRKESFLKRLFRKRRYYVRKVYFSLAAKLGFIE